MSPIVLAAVAAALVALGAVSMSSLAGQQAVSSAAVQRTTLDHDRSMEQTNAFISAVGPSDSSNTKATIKNTGSSAITVDHCLILSAQGGNGIRPAATSVNVNQVVNPGTTLDLTFSGSVSPENIKCVTARGSVIPVKLDGNGASSNYNITDDLAIYSISAKVAPGTKTFVTNTAYKPSGTPTPDYSTTPAGSLVWAVTVVASQITVNQVLRYDANNSPTDISSGLTGTYTANSQIQIPISGPTSKVVIKYTNSAGVQQTANIYPQTIAKVQGTVSLSAAASNTLFTSCEQIWNGYCYYPYTASRSDYAAGLTFSNYYYCCGNPTALTAYYASYPYYWGTYTNLDLLSSKSYSNYNYGFTATTIPETDHVFSFPAPSPSFTINLSYSRDASVGGQSAYNTNVVATTYTGVYSSNGFSQSNILPGAITIGTNCGFLCFQGSEHRDGTYQFRVENVQAGQQIQLRVAHGLSNSLQSPVCQTYVNYGTTCDYSGQTVSGSSTLTFSP